MTQIVLVSIGAGAAAALMFAALASGSALAVGLFYLAPLPVLLAAMAWTHVAGFAAAGIAALALGVVLGRWFIFAHLVAIGLPASLLGYLALLARPAPKPSAPDALEWYPVGRLVLASAIVAALSICLVIPAFGLDFESYRAAFKAALERVLRLQTATPAGQPVRLPNGADPSRLFDFLVVALPPLAAVLMMVTSLANLWFAGRIARASGRLRRPWPDVTAMTYPSMTPIALLVAVAVSLLSGLISLIATIFAATLLIAYALMGFAVLHGITRGLTARPFLLGAAWISVLVIGWPLVLLAILGLADGLLDLRGRVARRGPPNPPSLPGSPNRQE
jgi:hypothetical protein